jgi:hypothetical protein
VLGGSCRGQADLFDYCVIVFQISGAVRAQDESGFCFFSAVLATDHPTPPKFVLIWYFTFILAKFNWKYKKIKRWGIQNLN